MSPGSGVPVIPDPSGGSSFAATGGWPALLSKVFERRDLDRLESAAAFEEVFAGRATPAQTAALVAALRTKGETIDELTGFAETMRAHAESVVVPPGTIDTCGTGGDRSGTINVSTLAAIVAAGGGIPVCKHGGRASSSRAGSADVLEALGVVIDLGPAGVARCLEEAGIGFCLAARYHPAMRHAGPVRRELGVATVFNFLGPLVNPGGVTRQVVGVGDRRMATTMAGVLEANGVDHAIVCYGHDGLDELSTVTGSTIIELRRGADGAISRAIWEVDPVALGLVPAQPADLLGGDAPENAAFARAVLGGATGPHRDLVLLNAAAAFLVADAVGDLDGGLARAAESIDSGSAAAALDRLVAVSRAAGEAEGGA